MKYKFINEYSIKPYKKGFVVLDNKIYTNPTDEVLLKAGYKELNDKEPKPEYNIETQYLETKYVNTETEITITYEVKEIADIEIPEMIEGGG